jgi:hypothetical protein
MKSIIFLFVVLFVTSTAWAEGSIVRWDRIEGNLQHAADEPIEVAGILSSERGVTVTRGNAMLNLANGFLSVDVEGLSYDRHYPLNDRPIGTYPDGLRMATIVCDSTRAPEVVDSPPIRAVNGDWSYVGFIEVPASCREMPQLIVLLLRLAGSGPGYGQFLAYGADRTIK